MASTYSALKIELIGTGEQSGTWGTTTNNNLGNDALGEAITGSADVAFSSADVTVTLTDTNASQTARNLRLNLTGTSGGARQLILGSGCQIEKLYLINNTLADAVTVKNTSGTGIAVAAGKSMFVFNNGTNVVEAVTQFNGTIALASGVSGVLPIANGGTAGTASPTANGVAYGTGSAYAFTAAGTTGQVLSATTGSAPTWATISTKAFPTGTRMSFQQTAAPTGWTKDTTAGLDNSAMRIVTGSVSSGGSVNFTTAFASQTPTGSVSITAVSGSAGNTTLTTPQIPSHAHNWRIEASAGGNTSGQTTNLVAYIPQSGNIFRSISAPISNTVMIEGTGGSGAHSHPFSFSSGSGTFSGNAINLAVKYYDFIIASIN
jgi:hypothetical protein